MVSWCCSASASPAARPAASLRSPPPGPATTEASDPLDVFTIGYGGHTPSSFVEVLGERGVRTVVDVRIWPMRAHLGSFVLAKDPERGIAGLLARSGIAYAWWSPLGNPWFQSPGDSWAAPYRRLLSQAGELLTDGLDDLAPPLALLCSEKDPRACHRSVIAEYLTGTRGWATTHLA